jgi:hypothetical protein
LLSGNAAFILNYYCINELFAQTCSISLRYNQSVGEEAVPNCDKMKGTVQLVFCKLGTENIENNMLFAEINNKLQSFQ